MDGGRELTLHQQHSLASLEGSTLCLGGRFSAEIRVRLPAKTRSAPSCGPAWVIAPTSSLGPRYNRIAFVCRLSRSSPERRRQRRNAQVRDPDFRCDLFLQEC